MLAIFEIQQKCERNVAFVRGHYSHRKEVIQVNLMRGCEYESEVKKGGDHNKI